MHYVHSVGTVEHSFDYSRPSHVDVTELDLNISIHSKTVSVAIVKQYFVSLDAAHRPSWRVAYHSFTWLKTPLFNG